MESISIRAPKSATTLTAKEIWDAAFAAWESAKVAYEFADAAHDTARVEAGEDDVHKPALDRLSALEDETAQRENETRFGLILTPAPDFGAVQWKMQTLYGEGDHDGDDHSSAWHRRYPAAVIADVERLQSEFAVAWLAAWTKDGGSVVIDDDGKAQIGWATYDYSPNFRAPDPAWPEAVRDHSYICGQSAHDATMKARFEALKMHPAGVSAIKAHMRANGIRVAVHTLEQGA